MTDHDPEQQSAWQVVICFVAAFGLLLVAAAGGCLESCKQPVEYHGQVEVVK
jgi:hypothetical protein